MLTSSSQYLRPEYLTPLPTTLDAKKSPLALLAQTCSAIGADTPNPKLLASIEKSTKSSSTTSKTPTSTQSTTPVNNPSESNNNTINTKPIQSPLQSTARSSPLNTSISPKITSSFKPYEATPVKSPNSELRARTPKRTHTPLRSTSSNSSSTNSPLPDRQSPIHSSPKTSVLPPSPSYMLGLPSPLGFDHLKAAYLNYARGLKPAECRDPYCTGNCVPSVPSVPSMPSPNLGTKICPAGCVQCDHQKIPYGPSSANPAMAFAHAQLYALASAANQPYVCNWISSMDSNTYCGKRFSSSEELLQHLRQHTASSGADLVSQNAAHHLLSRNSYPTPPLSPLTLSGVRYHPYAKPMLPHGLSPPQHLNPMMSQAHLFAPGMGFSPYFGPYGGFVPPMPNLGLGQPQLGKSNGQNGLHH